MEDEGGGEKKKSRRGEDDHVGDEEARSFPMVPLHHKKSEDEKSESESESDIDEVAEEDEVAIPSTSDEEDAPSERNTCGRKMPRATSTTVSISKSEEPSRQGEQDRFRQPWTLLNFFRTEENERAPSRIRSTSKPSPIRKSEGSSRRKRVTYLDDEPMEESDKAKATTSKPQMDGPKDTHSTNSNVTTAESDSASDAQILRRRRRKAKPDGKKPSKKVATWHSTNNPLFKTKMKTDEQVEVVPLQVWFYEAILNVLWPPFNYYRLHFLYISLVSILGGLLIYLSQLGLSSQLSYMDALFHGVSASTQTGLFPTNFAAFSRLGQVILAGVMVMGNGVLITLAPVVIRLWHFHRYFKRNNAMQQRTDEYLALWQLLIIVPIYYAFFISTGWLVLATYAGANPDARDIIDRNDNNPAWWGLFHTISAFGNAGYSTFADSMVQWQTSPLPLIVMSFIILAGNTAFPPMMRLIVFTLYNVPFLKRYKHVYRFMLDHPRRCFTHLFPSAETRWLVLALLFLNSVEFLCEVILDWNNGAFSSLRPIEKLINMYFQSIAIRTSGFNSIDLTKLPITILWLYTGMMYISASPIAITVRYTGKSKRDSIAANGRELHTTNTVGSQAQNIFVKHAVFIFVAIMFITMIEEIPMRIDPNYSIFKVIFEVVSAYGTVGLSLGYGSAPYSFSGAWSDGSKFILIFIMMLGKQRGLPESIDSAIMMPPGYLDESEVSSEVEILSESESEEMIESESHSGEWRQKRNSASSAEAIKKKRRTRGRQSRRAARAVHSKDESEDEVAEKERERTDHNRKVQSKREAPSGHVLEFEEDDIPMDLHRDDISWLRDPPDRLRADDHPDTKAESSDLECGVPSS